MLDIFITLLRIAATDGSGATASGGALAALMGLYMGMIGVFGLVYCAIFIFAIVLFVLWVWMLIDCVSRDDFPGKDDKLLWALIILLGGGLGALIYYFVVKRKNDAGKIAVKK